MVFVVAEIGVNWDGDFELAKEMMLKAKEYGCNAVKFQSYKEQMVKDHPQRERLTKSAISETNVETINELANSVGIEWFCTPMYTEAIGFLDHYVKRYKIREFDGRLLLKNKTSELLDRILDSGKEIIASSNISPRNSKFFGEPNIKWLYCVPKYPCEISDNDFTDFGDFYGLSNHCPHFIVPVAAAILGAKLIEVHITSDKSKDFIDNNVSFDYPELKNIVDLIRLTEKIKR